jgi:hypothetical protein
LVYGELGFARKKYNKIYSFQNTTNAPQFFLRNKNMERIDYISIVDAVKSDKNIAEITKVGLCRLWAKNTIKLISQSFPNVEIEAREVDLEASLQHTFLRIVIPGEKPYVYDGVGTSKYPPFLGYEDDAPSHLKNSHPDMINSYVDKKYQ